MKKSIAILLALVTLCLCVCLISCKKSDKEITGVTLKSQTVNYDGEKHSLTVQGDLPKGAKVEYAYNLLNSEVVLTDGATEVGTYTVTATVTCAGYKKLELSATLTIIGERFPDDIIISMPDGINLPNSSYDWTGNKRSLTVTGTLPEGTQVTYYYNGVETDGVVDIGEYEVKAVLTCAGYETKTITRTLVIVPLKFKDFVNEQHHLNIDKISLEDQTITYDGNAHRLALLNIDQNFLPGLTNIAVTYNGEQVYEATEVGVYTVKWVITHEGYETLTLTGTLTITSLPQGE